MYRIKVRGPLDESWSGWFDGLTISCEGDTITLTGSVVDQSALLGILTKIGYLNLTLLSVIRIEADSAPEGEVR